MRIPTVKVRNKKTGETMIVNQADYAQGSLTSDMQLNATDWEIVGDETIGELKAADRDEADEQHADNSASMTAQVAAAEANEKKAVEQAKTGTKAKDK